MRNLNNIENLTIIIEGNDCIFRRGRYESISQLYRENIFNPSSKKKGFLFLQCWNVSMVKWLSLLTVNQAFLVQVGTQKNLKINLFKWEQIESLFSYNKKGYWCRGLTCHPVTVEIMGSNPIQLAKKVPLVKRLSPVTFYDQSWVRIPNGIQILIQLNR